MPEPPTSGAALSPEAAAFFQGTDAEPEAEDDVIEVLECNWPAVQVYLACQWTLHAGMGKPYWQGISAGELLAAMRVHCIRAAERVDITRRVRIMVAAAHAVLNGAD